MKKNVVSNQLIDFIKQYEQQTVFVFIEFFRVRTLHFPHPSKDRLFLSGGAECFSAICEVSL